MNKDHGTLDVHELRDLLLQDDTSLKTYFSNVTHAADLKEFFTAAEPSEWPRLLKLIEDPETRAEVVAELDESEWEQLLSLLGPDEIVSLVRRMESDDATDLIGKLPVHKQFEALRRLPPEQRRELQQLLRYPEDSAGGIMQVERAQVPVSATVADAVLKVRELVEDDVEVLAVWAVDEHGRLAGTLELVDLLLNKSTTKIQELVNSDIVTVQPFVDQEEVASVFKKYNLLALGVVDADNHLLGRIVIDDVVDVLAEEAEEDALRMGGTSAQEFLHAEAVLTTTKLRLPWLAVALLMSLVSALLLDFFASYIAKAAILACFVPVITAMGGNVGTQTATIVIRGLSTGKIDLTEVPRFLYKEIRVGLIMGLVYGFCAAIVATFIITHRNFYFGIVVFTAMLLTMITAATLGVLAPTALKKLNLDPAIASGPFVTTLNDITGILIYMCTAGFLLSYIA